MPQGTFTLQWHLTDRCNLRCKHCYQNPEISKEINLDRKKKIISDFVIFCKKLNKTPEISFTGGEPFILGQELFDLLNFCDEKFPEIKKSILSNGTLIDQVIINKFKKISIKSIQISLDGAKKDTHDFIRGYGAYKGALNALKNINSIGINTAVMFVFHKKNYQEIPELIDICNSLGVVSLGITAMVPEGRGKALLELMLTPEETHALYKLIIKTQIKLLNSGSKLKLDMKRPLWVLLKNEFEEYQDIIGGGCAAGFSGLTLMPNEDVMACRRLSIIIGNLKESTFFDIWYTSDLLDVLRNRDKVGECADCKYIKSCGGCRAVSYAIKGDHLKRDPYCWFTLNNVVTESRI